MNKSERSMWYNFFWLDKDSPAVWQIKETTISNFKVV